MKCEAGRAGPIITGWIVFTGDERESFDYTLTAMCVHEHLSTRRIEAAALPYHLQLLQQRSFCCQQCHEATHWDAGEPHRAVRLLDVTPDPPVYESL